MSTRATTVVVEDRARALALVPVSRETERRFEIFVDLLVRWQRIKNLVAPQALDEIWTRHLADSAQLQALLPDALLWADIGAGAGFPGLVTAMILADRPGTRVHLIESNSRKCAFLREAARATGAPALVHDGRIEEVLPDLAVDVLTARALAPLPRLIEFGKSHFERGGAALFLKSRSELEQVHLVDPLLELSVLPSRTSPDGRILHLRPSPSHPETRSHD